MTTTYRLRALPLVLALAACNPGGGGFTLTVPERASVTVGVPAAFVVNVQGATSKVALSVDGLPSGVTATFDPEETDGASTVTLTAADGSAAQSVPLTFKGTKGQAVKTAPLALTVGASANAQPTERPPLTVTLEKLFYAEGDAVKAVVDFGTLTAPSVVPDLIVSSGASLDAEHLKLVKGSGNTWVTEGALTISAIASAGAGAQNDGTLQLRPGDSFFAIYAVDHTQPELAKVEATLVSDFGLLDGPAKAETPTRVEPALALTPDEAASPRKVATLLRKNELPVQIAAEELIATPRTQGELDRILALTQATVLDEQPLDEKGEQKAYLLKVPTGVVTPARLSVMRSFLAETGELAASRQEALDVYGLTLMLRLEGLPVSVNPKLQGQAAPTHTEGEPGGSLNMQMLGRSGDGTACSPAPDAGNPCVRNVPALWTYLSVMDRDTRRIRVGVLDYGFAPNADFRPDTDGGFRECEMRLGGPRCGPGAARGTPNAGAFGGERVWHGTGSVTAIGGMVNDGFGGAGTGGQVAVPMMYRYDNLAFVFDIGRGVRQAVDDGASVINISAGYPCRVAVNVGPDLDLCTPAGRAAICAVTSAALTAAALVICTGPIMAIPIAGVIACGAATTAAVTATGACLSALDANFILGDPRGPMRSGIQYAHRAGVPVVVSAGNAYSSDVLPDVIRDYVNLGARTTEQWGVVPAMFPEVLTIGAVNESLSNQEFFGAKVDVWAPIFTRYTHPSSPDDAASALTFSDFSGTSDASPYTTGVVAAMQAVNPSLDPRTPGLTAAERAGIVERVRGILRGTAWTNAQLVTLGFADQPVERARLLNPIAAVRRASQGALPDLLALGYDQALNFDEATSPDDTAAQARVLSGAAVLSGTIGGIAPARGASPAADKDFVRVDGVGGSTTFQSQEVRVRFVGNETPRLEADRTEVQVAGPLLTRPSADEVEATFRVVTRAANATFAVTAVAGEDFVYKLQLGPKSVAPTQVVFTEPVPGTMARYCTNESISFRASALVTGTTFVPTSYAWEVDGVAAGTTTTPVLARTFATAGTHRVVVRSNGGEATSEVAIEVCTVVVRIAQPSMNVAQYPAGSSPSLAVTLVGDVRDGAGNPVPLTGLTLEWWTNRGDVQPGAPATGPQLIGTGQSIVGQFYGEAGQVSTDHQLTLVVKQGTTVLGTSPVRIISVLQLI